ncbi:MAG: anhydro-N-acetylmuramic acid kinase [Gammaproteobacteria bacterium]
MKNTHSCYAGIMTGNSMDAADAVLLSVKGGNMQVVASARQTMPRALAKELRHLAEGGEAAAAAFMRAQNKLTKLCAAAFVKLGKPAAAVGCHGQTICHNPARGFSMQMLNGALLAELTKCDVVCDFRARDIATGGQGAPLAPFFHHAVFAKLAPCAVVNIGGIANITMLEDDGNMTAWDTGPGCMLMDDWHRQKRGGNFDSGGRWAAGGKVIAPLLAKWQRRRFFIKPPPKSCGREEFSPALFCDDYRHNTPRDIQRTLLELTAQAIADAAGVKVANKRVIKKSATTGKMPIYLCGGGARNDYLANRIAALSKAPVYLSDSMGIAAEQMEAAAFAWLAMQHLRGKPINTTAPRIAGAHYPK